MTTSLDLNVAKKNLSEALGDGMKTYLNILNSWFKRKISREDFDHEARKMLSTDSVHLHNQFLLAILAKCHSLSGEIDSQSEVKTSTDKTVTSSVKPPKKSASKLKRKSSHPTRPNFQQRFVQVNELCQALPVNLPSPEQDDKTLTFASKEMLLPDIGMVHGRMMVSAWDYGVDSVDDNAVRIMMHAIDVMLKNILTVMFVRRNSYHVKEKRFRHNFGSYTPLTSLRNSSIIPKIFMTREPTSVSSKGVHIPSMKPSFEVGSRDAALKLTCGDPIPPAREERDLYDLFETLQIHKCSIPSHTVYITNMERIINRLWHPSHEDMEQEELQKQEVIIKHNLSQNDCSPFT